MPNVCAIYGNEFTNPFTRGCFRFVPRYNWVTDANKAARDKTRYVLTGLRGAIPTLSWKGTGI